MSNIVKAIEMELVDLRRVCVFPQYAGDFFREHYAIAIRILWDNKKFSWSWAKQWWRESDNAIRIGAGADGLSGDLIVTEY